MAAVGAVQREILDRGLARLPARDLVERQAAELHRIGLFARRAASGHDDIARAKGAELHRAERRQRQHGALVRRRGGVPRPGQRRLGERARPQPQRRDRPGVDFDPGVGEGERDALDRGLLLDGLGLLLVVFAREGQDMRELARIDALGRKIRVARLDGAARPLGALLQRRGAQRADAAIGYVFEHDVLIDEPRHALAGLALAAYFGNHDALRGDARQPFVKRGFVLGVGEPRQLGAGQRPALDRQARDRKDHRADLDDEPLGRRARVRAGGEASDESRERDQYET